MLTSTPATWTVRGATFALWALAAASAAYWGLKLGDGGRGREVPLPPARAVLAADPAALAGLLGGSPAAAAAVVASAGPTLASRLQLLGVAAGERSGAGAAVISIDGKPPRPYRVGSPIEEGLVLHSVHGRQATLVQADGTQLVLEVPPATQAASQVPPAGAAAPVIAPPLAPPGLRR